MAIVPLPRYYRNNNLSLRFNGGQAGSRLSVGSLGQTASNANWYITGDQISISCWVYMFDHSGSGRDDRYISRQNSSAANDHSFMMGSASADPGVDQQARVRIAGTTATLTWLPNVNVVQYEREWLHLMYTYDQTRTPRHQFYENGSGAASNTTDIGSLQDITGAETLIGQGDGTSSSPDGCIAHAAVWARALTLDEGHRVYYGSPFDAHPQDIVFYYAGNAGAGAHYDLAPRQRHPNVARSASGTDTVKLEYGYYKAGDSGPGQPPQGVPPRAVRSGFELMPRRFVGFPDAATDPIIALPLRARYG